MTFCFFSTQYLPTVGGVERYTNSLATRLVAQGHHVLVVTSSVDNLPMHETCEGIEIYRVPSVRLMGGRMPVVKIGSAWGQTRRLLEKIPIDFIVIQTRFYPLCLLGAKMAKKRRIRAIVVEHGTAHLMRSGIAGFLGNIYEHTMLHIIRHYCNDFYGVSKASAAWLTHFHVSTDHVLHNAVDPFALCALAQHATCANDFTFTGQKVIAFTGRLIPEKGVLPLLSAFASVRKKHPNSVLCIAGDGPLYEHAKKNLPSGAYLLGMLPYEETLALLQRADIYCLPTFSEGFSCAILEAAALHAAIITTPTGGSPELLIDDAHGCLISDMTAPSIARALDMALSDDDWCKKASENAYNYLLSHFTWDKISDTLLRIAMRQDVSSFEGEL